MTKFNSIVWFFRHTSIAWNFNICSHWTLSKESLFMEIISKLDREREREWMKQLKKRRIETRVAKCAYMVDGVDRACFMSKLFFPVISFCYVNSANRFNYSQRKPIFIVNSRQMYKTNTYKHTHTSHTYRLSVRGVLRVQVHYNRVNVLFCVLSFRCFFLFTRSFSLWLSLVFHFWFILQFNKLCCELHSPICIWITVDSCSSCCFSFGLVGSLDNSCSGSFFMFLFHLFFLFFVRFVWVAFHCTD